MTKKTLVKCLIIVGMVILALFIIVVLHLGRDAVGLIPVKRGTVRELADLPAEKLDIGAICLQPGSGGSEEDLLYLRADDDKDAVLELADYILSLDVRQMTVFDGDEPTDEDHWLWIMPDNAETGVKGIDIGIYIDESGFVDIEFVSEDSRLSKMSGPYCVRGDGMDTEYVLSFFEGDT